MAEQSTNAKRHYIGRLMPPDTACDIRLPIDEVLPALRDALRLAHADNIFLVKLSYWLGR